MRYGAILWAVLLVLPSVADGIGLSYADSRVFPHGYTDFDNAGALSLTDYPFAGIGRRISFQTSYRSLYCMKELTDSRAAMAIAWRRVQFGGAVSIFGEGGYFQQLGLSCFGSYRAGAFSVGGALVYSRLSFSDAYDYLSTVTGNLGLSYTHGGLTGFAITRSFNQPHYYNSSLAVMPEAEIGVSYKSRDGLDSRAKAFFLRHQKPTAELSQAFWFTDYIRVSWALVLLPARFGGGLHLEKKSFGFDYKYSHHPVLGATHTVMLSAYTFE